MEYVTHGDRPGVEAYVASTSDPFSIFFDFEQGSTMRLAGIPIESKFYLVGNALIARGLFEYSGAAGLGAPVRICVSQRDGEQTRIDLDQNVSFFSKFPETELEGNRRDTCHSPIRIVRGRLYGPIIAGFSRAYLRLLSALRWRKSLDYWALLIYITLDAGVVFSNNPPLSDPLSTAPLSPFNALAGIDVNPICPKVRKSRIVGLKRMKTRVEDVPINSDHRKRVDRYQEPANRRILDRDDGFHCQSRTKSY
jgi:hypothetical protein